jgi:hypothetical protein
MSDQAFQLLMKGCVVLCTVDLVASGVFSFAYHRELESSMALVGFWCLWAIAHGMLKRRPYLFR